MGYLCCDVSTGRHWRRLYVSCCSARSAPHENPSTPMGLASKGHSVAKAGEFKSSQGYRGLSRRCVRAYCFCHCLNIYCILTMKTKAVVVPLVLLLLFGSLISASAQPVDIDSPALHWASIGTGVAVGLALDTYIGFIAFSDPETPLRQQLAVFVPTAVVGMASSMLTTSGFFRLISAEGDRGSLVLGALGGMVEGAIIGGLTIGTLMGANYAVNPDFMNVNGEWNNAWDVVGLGIFGGGLFGAPIGILSGAIAGLILQISLHR